MSSMKKNKTIHLLILISTAILLSSCETQIGTAIGAAFTNIFTGRGFQSSSGTEAYEQMKSEALSGTNHSSAFGGGTGDPACSNPGDALSVLNKRDSSNLSGLKDKMCTCEAWGTCDAKSCSCQKLCPKNFEILNRSKSANDDSKENSLSFTNSDSDFYTKYKDYTGFCWGHAVITQRFNRLAKFNPNLGRVGGDDPIVRQRELKYIISKLNNNEPVDINGYKNLHDFSSDPEVKELLEETVKKNWARNAMSTQGLHIVASGEPNPVEETRKLFEDIDFRVKHNQMPAVVFNDKNSASYAHTVLVSGTGTGPDGKRFLCIRDNNYAPERSYNCQNKMVLNDDGSLKYSSWPYRTIGKIELSYTENGNVVEQINNLHSKCASDKECDRFFN